MKNKALCGFVILTIGLGVVANILLTVKVQALNKNGTSILLNNKKIKGNHNSDTTIEEEKLLNLKFLPNNTSNQCCGDD